MLKEQPPEKKPAVDMSFPGKIAIVSDSLVTNEDSFHSAEQLVAKYNSDKIIHVTWPENFIAEQDKMIGILSDLALDKEIRVLIINQDIPGTNVAVDNLKKTRDDIFIIYCILHEKAADIATRANLLLAQNESGVGAEIVKQAKKQGAKVFVHYSFPRHMSIPLIINRYEMIRKTCAAEGLLFVDATTPDPVKEAGLSEALQFIIEDVPKHVAKYGDDTAFFATNCRLQAPLIKAVIDNHAIFPQPCCPSPFHGFPEALGIKNDRMWTDINNFIGEASRLAAEKNMTDRLSTWPVSASLMFVNAGAEYAIKWLKGTVPKDRIDVRTLANCMNGYVKEVVGEGIEIDITSYSDNGIIYDNIKTLLMSYLDF